MIGVTDRWREGTIDSIDKILTNKLVDRTKDSILNRSNDEK